MQSNCPNVCISWHLYPVHLWCFALTWYLKSCYIKINNCKLILCCRVKKKTWYFVAGLLLLCKDLIREDSWCWACVASFTLLSFSWIIISSCKTMQDTWNHVVRRMFCYVSMETETTETELNSSVKRPAEGQIITRCR